ncbi:MULTISPECIES: TetR/AcrR family transcriptional regulator [Shewanella]|uniref:TetR family transcriptional regulator n=1 Tax=Shewanella marisflavi TaxID=260364 RepID=A0AAC9U2W5_9GAMM|nr:MULTISPECIES: TetR/AcrR family transcriptional regulator [Shewanella]ASJ98398.1 TetR family transcriptional regulator [Shewanella marisflavi]MCL1043342.1 TetR/AcrR family transcriptional regulator [Shewanella marisflavi]QDF76997.1 TetR/AcrR family transcriptional regulator [Shewanella marisflavi]
MKTRDKIVHASLALFNEHGERSITTNHIAAHLGISPGNLYYHFRNKEDIIRSIFKLYEQHLESGFQPYEGKKVDVDLLIGYFDALFYTLWQFRFMYANLVIILSRDEVLNKEYTVTHEQVLKRATSILTQLKQDGVLVIDDEEITPLADTIRMVACFWISNELTHSETTRITKTSLYEGLLRVLMIFKAYASESAKPTFIRLEQHYKALAKAEQEED